MGLRFKNSYDFGDLGFHLKNVSRKASKGAAGEMRRAAYDVKELSVRMAPVDKQNLEKAHEVVERRGDRNRIEFSVEVGGFVGGRNVDEYALFVHENYGSVKRRGKGTIEKQKADPSVEVGEKFLERAFEQVEKGIDDELADVFARQF